MQDYIVKIEDLKFLEENLTQAMEGIQKAQEFGVFSADEYDLKTAHKIVSNCYEVARGKLAQAEVKKQIVDVIKRAKNHYIMADDLEQIIKSTYGEDE